MGKIVIVVGVLFFAVILLGGAAFFVMNTQQANQVPPTPTPPPAAPVTPPPAPIEKAQDLMYQVTLTVISPADKAIVTSSRLTIIGQTLPNAEVTINEIETEADSKGNFRGTIQLTEGENPIVVDAFDADGNYSEKELTVTYEPAS